MEKIDESYKLAPSSLKQQQLIEKILADFPDSREMLEYEDYTANPTKGNASEFITRALEDNAYEVMLSYISINKDGWQRHSYAASCGVSSIVMHQMLKDNPNIQKVCLCHDNDEGGEKAVIRIAAELDEKGIAYEWLIPVLKDWNDMLTHPDEVEEAVCSQPMIHF